MAGENKQGGSEPTKPVDNLHIEQAGPPKDRDPRLPNAERTQAAQPARSIPPFVVECGDYKSSGLITVDHLLMRLRGRWDKSNIVGNGEMIHMLPAVIPGIYLQVNPRDLLVTIYDPLTDRPEILEQVTRAYKSDGNVTIRDASDNPIGKAHDTIKLKRDVHEMKSLLLEIARKTLSKDKQANSFFVERGNVPTEQELEGYPGHELYDPHSTNHTRPRFVKDVDTWRSRLDRAAELTQ